MISIAFVVASTVGMTLNTIPSIQHRNAEGEAIDNPKLALIEAICISWFTIEYLLRFAGKAGVANYYSAVTQALITVLLLQALRKSGNSSKVP